MMAGAVASKAFAGIVIRAMAQNGATAAPRMLRQTRVTAMARPGTKAAMVAVMVAAEAVIRDLI
ncbi:MAG TPA: hypothetical protein VMU87_14575 [Stellaceae bacterium]|nr:hypothetical protein [Stellaceae bacterium]